MELNYIATIFERLHFAKMCDASSNQAKGLD